MSVSIEVFGPVCHRGYTFTTLQAHNGLLSAMFERQKYFIAGFNRVVFIALSA